MSMSKIILVLCSSASTARINGIARFAREHDWILIFENELSNPPYGWRGNGVLVTMKDTPALRTFAAELRRAKVPFVNVSGQFAKSGMPTVCGDDAMIGRLAAEHFRDRRFRHVAWFSSKWGNVHEMRFSAFSEACRTFADGEPMRLVWSENSASCSTGWRPLAEWLGAAIRKAKRPLGIFAYSDYDASRVLNICREGGIDVPGEVAILGVDDNRLICLNQAIPLSSVNHNLERIGYAGAALLERLVNGGHAPKSPICVPPQGITVRRSTDTVAAEHPDVRAAMAYIVSHLAEPIGSPQIAEKIGVSRLKLDRLFARELGMSVGREIARQRLVLVRRLLSGTGLSLSEIAKKAGYCNASHLANTFRRESGETPGSWRDANRTPNEVAEPC